MGHKEDNNGTTPQAKEALSLAVEMAESLNHGYVGTEHLLIGLLQEGTGVAARVLEENGVCNTAQKPLAYNQFHSHRHLCL